MLALGESSEYERNLMPAAGDSAAAPGASGGLQALIPGMGAVCQCVSPNLLLEDGGE